MDDLSGDFLEDVSVRTRPLLLSVVCISIALLGVGGFSLYTSLQSSQTPIQEFHPKRTLTIDISGAVKTPGVQIHSLSFDEDLHLHEVIQKAGGFTDDADTQRIAEEINLASTVTDGQKILIPKKGTVAGSTIQQQSENGKISINRASQHELETLKGIGAGRAKAIIEARPFQTIAELTSKAKIPESVVTSISNEISL